MITHAYGKRKGIRYLSNGLKVFSNLNLSELFSTLVIQVYYLPFVVVYNGCSLATIIGSLPWLRKIFLREQIQLVHGHSVSNAFDPNESFSVMLYPNRPLIRGSTNLLYANHSIEAHSRGAKFLLYESPNYKGAIQLSLSESSSIRRCPNCRYLNNTIIRSFGVGSNA